MIRESFKAELVRILEENTNLYAEDFVYVNEVLESGAQFRMEYFYNNRYFFNVDILSEEVTVEKETYLSTGTIKTKSKQVTYECLMCPGEVFDSHSEKEFTLDGLNNVFGKWTKRVEEDISATSIHKKLDKISREFEDFKIEFGDENTYFTNEEAKEFYDKLNKLEEMLTSHIEGEEGISSELNKMKADFKMLHESLYTDTKGHWSKKMFTRLKRWASDPNNQQKVLTAASQVKGLIETHQNSNLD